VFGGTPDTTEGLRSRVARGRPNWWVILAVSLGLMALLVATAGGTPHAAHRTGGSAQAASRTSGRSGTSAGQHTGAPSLNSATTTTSTSTTGPATQSGSANVTSSLHTPGTPSGATAPVPTSPGITATTVAPVATTTTTTTTTTSGSSAEVPADRTQSPGYLNPPQHADDQFGFTGTGAMDVSVVWSGDTYLSLQVNCPSGDQSAGGTSAMEASLPDADGSCIATVTEPASETTALTFTISIGPTGG
jgi:hypothetical protein